MEEIVSERIKQVTEMIRELEGQIRQATSIGQPIHGVNTQKAVNDLFSAMGSLYFSYMPPHIIAQILNPATVVGTHVGQQTRCNCPDCNYPISMVLT